MININELGKKKRQRDKVRLNTYKNILLKCHHKIKCTDDKTDTNMFFNIPEYLFGYPKYNILECHDYLKKKLVDTGFIVYDVNPYRLFISWGHVSHTKKYISYPTPKKEPEIPKQKLYLEQTIQYRDINDQINTNDLFS